MAIILIEFEKRFAEISEEQLTGNYFDVDFNGEIMVRFEKIQGKCVATNGVNGYGNNIMSEVGGKTAKMYREIELWE